MFTLNSLIRKTAAAMFAVAALISVSQPASAQAGIDFTSQEKLEFSVDVAEDMAKFFWTPPLGGSTTDPSRGAFFVTEGNMYMAGTIPGAGENFDPNSSMAIGKWYCKGTFLAKGSEFPNTAIAVLTDQLYVFADDRNSIATTGTEGNGLAIRVVAGGTGVYRGYVGEQRQTFLGFNAGGGVNLRVTFTLRRTK